MGFTSQLYPGEPIYDDCTSLGELIDSAPEGMSRGLELPEDRGDGYGYAGAADPFPAELLIPMSDVPAMVQEKEARKTRTSDLVAQAGLPCKDQNGTNFCWINGPTYAMEVVRVVQNQPMVILSPASVGCRIKNFRNNGGWGYEGLRYIAERGVVPVSMWPANAINRQYDTEAAWVEAAKFRALEWWEAKPRNFEQHVSLILRGWTPTVGLNYWSHQVTDEDVVILDGEVCIRFRNSWGMSWGSSGYGIRRGSKKYADDIVAPRVAVAS